jgi:hypothetical protein
LSDSAPIAGRPTKVSRALFRTITKELRGLQDWHTHKPALLRVYEIVLGTYDKYAPAIRHFSTNDEKEFSNLLAPIFQSEVGAGLKEIGIGEFAGISYVDKNPHHIFNRMFPTNEAVGFPRTDESFLQTQAAVMSMFKDNLQAAANMVNKFPSYTYPLVSQGKSLTGDDRKEIEEIKGRLPDHIKTPLQTCLDEHGKSSVRVSDLFHRHLWSKIPEDFNAEADSLIVQLPEKFEKGLKQRFSFGASP